MSTTTYRLPEDLKAAIERLAAQSGQTSHAYAIDALRRQTEQDAARLDFHAEAERRLKRMLHTGEYLAPEDLRAYAQALARGEQPPPPAPRKHSPDELARLRASARRAADA